MIDVVKELGDVPIHHPVLSPLDVVLCCARRIVRTFPRPEALAVRMEGGVEDGLQLLQEHVLYPSIEHRRNAQ